MGNELENQTHGIKKLMRDRRILTPATIAALNTRIVAVIPNAVEAFTHTEIYQGLPEAGRAKALDLLANGVARGIAEFVEQNAPKLNGYGF